MEECVRLFAKRGAKVVFTGTSEKKADAVFAKLKREGLESGGPLLQGRHQQRSNVCGLVKFVTATFGDCEVLCNNAGILVGGAVHETSPEDWNKVFAVNVTGTYLCCRHFLPAMIRNRRGAIVNTASISGMLGEYNMAAYCATKGAICNLPGQWPWTTRMSASG